MAHFVSPVVSEDGVYLGSELETRSEGLYKQDQGFIQTDDGRTMHAFRDVELESEDEQRGGFDMDSYTDSLNEVYPNLHDAIQWAASGQAYGFDVEDFNRALDSQDLHSLNKGIEQLLNLYNEANPTKEHGPVEHKEEQVEPTPEELEEAHNYVSNEIENLRGASYSEEQVEYMADVQAEFDADSTESFILELGQRIGRGEMDFDQALSHAMQNVPADQLVAAYNALTARLN